MNKVLLNLALVAMAGCVFGVAMAASSPEEGPHGPGQAIADKVREVAGTDFAFIPGGVLRDSVQKVSLSEYLSAKGERIAVVKLTGKQIREALERSVSMAPSPNPSFLQVSGLSVVYKKSTFSDRLVSVTPDTGKLDNLATYTVAMPQTMAKGGFGYLVVWDTAATSKVLNVSLADAVKGMAYQDTEPRYKAVD